MSNESAGPADKTTWETESQGFADQTKTFQRTQSQDAADVLDQLAAQLAALANELRGKST